MKFDFDPKDHDLVIAGIMVQGYADGTMIKVMRNEDAVSLRVGATGDAVRMINRNRSGKIEVTLLPGSPTNDAFSLLLEADQRDKTGVGDGQLSDANGRTKMHCANVWCVKYPEHEISTSAPNKTWTFETDNMDLFIGGANS